MRIALVAPSYGPEIGGVETHVRHLALGCAEAGDEVTVITHQFGAAPPEERAGRVRVLRFPPWFGSRTYPVAPAMFRYLRSHAADFDVVHGHNYHSLAGHAAARSRLPFVFTPHYNATGHTRFRTGLHRLYRPAGARQFAAAAVVICVSGAERETLIRDFPMVAGKAVTVPNGTDPRRPAPGGGAGQPHPPVVLAVGRLERYKNVDLVIDAFRALPDAATLVVAGDGPERARLEQHARATGPGQPIRFTGRLPDPMLDDLFARATVVTSASDYEAFGLALADGLASGARVVASAIGAHADLARRAGPGAPVALVDSRNAGQFADALAASLRAGRSRPGEVALPSWAEVVRDTRAIYSRLTAKGRAGNVAWAVRG
jgi:glycosyltransferase involved in cell wall biosynthesis